MKRIVVIFSSLILVAALCGCTQGDKTTTNSNGAKSFVSNQTEISNNKTMDSGSDNVSETIEESDEGSDEESFPSEPQESSTESTVELQSNRSVTLNIHCEENLVFSKYGIKVYVDNNEIGSIVHGGEGSYTLDLPDGQYVVRFANDENDSVDGTSELEIKSDVIVEYKLECKKDKVIVTILSQNEKPKGNQASMPKSSAGFRKKQLKEVQEMLASAGFTNIKTEKIEDLIIGILTSENEVESVTVNGSTDYSEGNVFEKDVEIVITYHTFPEETSDESSVASSSVDESSEITNNSEFELAFVKRGREYNSYYLFDTDTQTVTYFSTNDTSIMTASYTGNFETGVEMNWEAYGEGWHDRFVYTGGTKGVWYDYLNNDYEFSKCEVEEAQKALDKITNP